MWTGWEQYMLPPVFFSSDFHFSSDFASEPGSSSEIRSGPFFAVAPNLKRRADTLKCGRISVLKL
jgi:hypothetical protein